MKVWQRTCGKWRELVECLTQGFCLDNDGDVVYNAECRCVLSELVLLEGDRWGSLSVMSLSDSREKRTSLSRHNWECLHRRDRPVTYLKPIRKMGIWCDETCERTRARYYRPLKEAEFAAQLQTIGNSYRFQLNIMQKRQPLAAKGSNFSRKNVSRCIHISFSALKLCYRIWLCRILWSRSANRMRNWLEKRSRST